MLDTIFNILKVTVAIAVGALFLVAINTIINLISMAVFSSIVGEIIGVISCCLPFDASAVFGGLFTATTAILAFLVAKKIFELTSWTVSST